VKTIKTFKKIFDVELPSGQEVKVMLSHSTEKCERPVKVESGMQAIAEDFLIPRFRKVRDRNGNVLTTPVSVPGVRIRLRFSDGHLMEGRACCKPPDTFKTKMGLRRAIHRIFKVDSGISLHKFAKGGQPLRDKSVKPRLTGTDRKQLYRAIMRKGKPFREKKKEETTTTSTETKVG
jgi:hypothetical protein